MTQILIRRGTAAQWTSSNPVLGLGEIGYETDTRKSKVGDGATLWNSLAYWIPTLPSGAVVGTNDSQVLTNKTISGASNTLTNVPTSALTLGGAASAYVATQESTSSTSFIDLATTTDSVTVTVGASGLALVNIKSWFSTGSAGAWGQMAYAVSGATTIGPGANGQFISGSNSLQEYGASFLVTGLNAGSTTFKAKYSTTSGTASFSRRCISVIPL